MHRFKLSPLDTRSYCSSTSDIVSHYFNCRIKFLLSRQSLDLKSLLQSHAYLLTTGQRNNLFLASKLISLYATLNQVNSSTKVFDSTQSRDHFLWNSIIKAHFSNGNHFQALEVFDQMRVSNFFPNQFTVPMVVSACAELGMVKNGIKMHAMISKSNLFNANSAVGSSFVYMYAKCGYVDDASLVFDEILKRDVVAWTALVIGYVQNGRNLKGLECFREMHNTGGVDEKPNFRTLEGAFQACANSSAFLEGKCLHGLSIKSGFGCSHAIQASLLSMYSKCSSIEDACRSFLDIVNKDLLSWTLIIGLYAKLEDIDKCVEMFLKMLNCDLYPDGILLSCVLLGFGNSKRILEGKAFHGFILRQNHDLNQLVYHGLLSMYCKFGLANLAENVFSSARVSDTESWNLMVVAFGKARLESKCIELFRKMQHMGIKYDVNCMVSVISSCSRLEATLLGKSLHCHSMKSLTCESLSVANSLIDMYGKSGNLNTARRIFCMTEKDTVTWNVLISCYAHNGHATEALALYDKMISEDFKPNAATLVILLSTCSQAASLEKGEEIHRYIKRVEFEPSLSLDTALVDMYAKCGQLRKAREVFNLMNGRDAISYNVMISGYGMHGDVKSAMEIFQQMEESDVRPNELTFLAILSACTHAGLVEEGKSLFQRMNLYSVVPTLKHYACLVDLLGRSGNLNEAEEVILSMPICPDAGIWGSLLSSCKLHNDAEIGMRIARLAIESDPENDGYYVALSDMYSSMGLWEEVEGVRDVMKGREVRKRVGWSAF